MKTKVTLLLSSGAVIEGLMSAPGSQSEEEQEVATEMREISGRGGVMYVLYDVVVRNGGTEYWVSRAACFGQDIQMVLSEQDT